MKSREGDVNPLAFLFGLALLLIAFLLLTTTPQLVYRWSHRDGYTKTEIEVLSPPDSHLSSMTVRVLSTGDELSIRWNTFERSREQNRLPAFYNPDARQLVLGIGLFDERLVSAERTSRLQSGKDVALLVAVNATVGLLGFYLVTAGKAGRRSSLKRKRRR